MRIFLLSAACLIFVMIWAGDARADRTVERHAICWKGNKQVAYPHWKHWRGPPGGWKDTTLPCKNLYVKGFAVLNENGNVIRIQKHRTYVVPNAPPDPLTP